MLDDALLEIGCIRCKILSTKGMWQIRGGYCPLCNPGYRGGSISAIHSVRKNSQGVSSEHSIVSLCHAKLQL